ncbi:hypothetical protein TNCV_5035691 [Trichonephila clavipes]|nr:hypothetical protein TNCV_5035691 [Trichonephila clavipes]
MAHVDALSRPPHCMLIQNSVHLQFLKAQQADDQITTIKTLLETTLHDSYITIVIDFNIRYFFDKNSTQFSMSGDRLRNIENPDKLVFAFRSIERDRSAAETFCGLMNLPSPPEKFRTHTEILFNST